MSAGNIVQRSRMISVNIECDTDAQEETLYTCPPNCRAHVSMMHIVNAGGTISLSVDFDRHSNTQTKLGVDAHAHILGGKNMSTGEYIQFTGAELVMEPGDSIKCTADGSTPHVDVLATIEEFFISPN